MPAGHHHVVDAVESGDNAATPTDFKQLASCEAIGAESVTVTVKGAEVAIVVRAEELAEQEVVRCAFETARQLTGQSSTLRQLVLNGRTLYQQRNGSNMQDRRTSTLAFAC